MRWLLALVPLACWVGCDFDPTAAGPTDGGGACSGYGCPVITTCADGAHTTITGTVFAPNATLPLYGVTVFVPTVPLDPFTPGVSCDRCSNPVSGEPAALTTSGPDGTFKLVDVPSGHDIPLVVQLGRWRRQVTIPRVPACTSTELGNAQATRLPRNQSEGDIPLTAIAAAGSDPVECLLLKLGIDPAEITRPVDGGRFHFYRATDGPGLDLGRPAPHATELYSSLANLTNYDVVLLPCEGAPFDKHLVEGTALSEDPRVLLAQYVDLGGRVFTTHYSYDWLTYDGSPFNAIATPSGSAGEWPVQQPDDFTNTISSEVSLASPQDDAFAQWLGYAGVASPPDRLDITEGRHDITGVDPQLARPWVTYDFGAVGGGPGVMQFTFDTPLDPPLDPQGEPQYCGRVGFSDFHVAALALEDFRQPFPTACNALPMTDQEKALAFMLFDLSSCVSTELL